VQAAVWQERQERGLLRRSINHKEDRIMIIDMGQAEGRVDERIRFLGIKQKWETHRARIFQVQKAKSK